MGLLLSRLQQFGGRLELIKVHCWPQARPWPAATRLSPQASEATQCVCGGRGREVPGWRCSWEKRKEATLPQFPCQGDVASFKQGAQNDLVDASSVCILDVVNEALRPAWCCCKATGGGEIPRHFWPCRIPVSTLSLRRAVFSVHCRHSSIFASGSCTATPKQPPQNMTKGRGWGPRRAAHSSDGARRDGHAAVRERDERGCRATPTAAKTVRRRL